jgi:hypothetical protein
VRVVPTVYENSASRRRRARRLRFGPPEEWKRDSEETTSPNNQVQVDIVPGHQDVDLSVPVVSATGTTPPEELATARAQTPQFSMETYQSPYEEQSTDQASVKEASDEDDAGHQSDFALDPTYTASERGSISDDITLEDLWEITTPRRSLDEELREDRELDSHYDHYPEDWRLSQEEQQIQRRSEAAGASAGATGEPVQGATCTFTKAKALLGTPREPGRGRRRRRLRHRETPITPTPGLLRYDVSEEDCRQRPRGRDDEYHAHQSDLAEETNCKDQARADDTSALMSTQHEEYHVSKGDRAVEVVGSNLQAKSDHVDIEELNDHHEQYWDRKKAQDKCTEQNEELRKLEKRSEIARNVFGVRDQRQDESTSRYFDVLTEMAIQGWGPRARRTLIRERFLEGLMDKWLASLMSVLLFDLTLEEKVAWAKSRLSPQEVHQIVELFEMMTMKDPEMASCHRDTTEETKTDRAHEEDEEDLQQERRFQGPVNDEVQQNTVEIVWTQTLVGTMKDVSSMRQKREVTFFHGETRQATDDIRLLTVRNFQRAWDPLPDIWKETRFMARKYDGDSKKLIIIISVSQLVEVFGGIPPSTTVIGMTLEETPPRSGQKCLMYQDAGSAAESEATLCVTGRLSENTPHGMTGYVAHRTSHTVRGKHRSRRPPRIEVIGKVGTIQTGKSTHGQERRHRHTGETADNDDGEPRDATELRHLNEGTTTVAAAPLIPDEWLDRSSRIHDHCSERDDVTGEFSPPMNRLPKFYEERRRVLQIPALPALAGPPQAPPIQTFRAEVVSTGGWGSSRRITRSRSCWQKPNYGIRGRLSQPETGSSLVRWRTMNKVQLTRVRVNRSTRE